VRLGRESWLLLFRKIGSCVAFDRNLPMLVKYSIGTLRPQKEMPRASDDIFDNFLTPLSVHETL